MRDFKKFTSKGITDAIEEIGESRKNWMLRLFMHAAKRRNKKGTFQVWTHENHATHLYSKEVIQEKVDYIDLSPVRSGIVSKPEEYLYSSARNYAGMDGLLTIVMIPMLWKTY